MTKKQIKAMQSALTGAWLTLRDMGLPAAVFSARLPEKRLELVLGGVRELAAMNEGRAVECRATAAHFTAHPSVYGEATPEIVDRFTALAAKYDKDAAWFRAMEQRIASEGLPPDVVGFDPTATR
jgi:hypothetical protein